MLFIVGVIIVLGCVLSGYALHGGNLAILWQPTEVLIICGAAAGSFIINHAGKRLKSCLKALKYLFKGSPVNQATYIEALTMMFAVFKLMRTKGMLEIESHIEAPEESALFSNYPGVVKNPHALHFFCDYLRVMTMGVEDPVQLDALMKEDLAVSHHEHHSISHAWEHLGDAFPALGIVAAVLGVIITMGSIDQPPTILGGLIGAALVGTFLGIFVAYGFVGPIGGFIGEYYEDEHAFINCLKAGMIAHLKGCAPAVSIEFARNVIPPCDRPDFKTVEDAVANAPGG